jgi:polysaccharide biosynthesis transport protein
MQKRPPSEVTDYIQIALRRKWWIILPTVVVAFAVAAVSVKLPKYYRSETMIQVNPQTVPEKFVQSTVSTDITDRLTTISQEILSRTRLEKIIDQFGLYRDLKGRMSQEDIIEMMRTKDIKVDVVTDASPSSRIKTSAAFKISFTGKDPALVQQVTRQIASLYIEENMKVREKQAEGTNIFISAELEKARQALNAQEERIKSFKGRFMGSLPEQQTANLAMAGQLQGMLQNNNDAITRLQQQKSYYESMLQAMEKTQTPVLKTGFQAELDTRRAELVAAEEKYTKDHPDVKRLRSEVKALEAKAASLAANEPTTDNEPGSIKAQLAAVNLELKERNQRNRELESKLRGVQGRIEMLPVVEQQFSEINRDYTTTKENYKSLLEKQNSSAMAAEMERNAKGEQFRVLDPANLPEKPFKPDLLQLNAMGLFGGLAVGCAFAFLFEMKDPSLHDEKDLAYQLPVKVLGTLPVIQTPASIKQERTRRIREYAIGGVAAGVLVGTVLLLYRSSPELFKGIL